MSYSDAFIATRSYVTLYSIKKRLSIRRGSRGCGGGWGEEAG